MRAPDSCCYHRAGQVSDNDIYGAQASTIKKAPDASLTQSHAGNAVHPDFNIDGTPEHFIIKGGDKKYCQAPDGAARHTRFPAFTDRHVCDVMGSARGDMQGQP